MGVENKISGVEQKTDALAREVGEIKVELKSPRQSCAAIRVAKGSSSSSHRLQEALQCRVTLELASGARKVVTAKIDTMSDIDAVSNHLYDELKKAGVVVIENPPTLELVGSKVLHSCGRDRVLRRCAGTFMRAQVVPD